MIIRVDTTNLTRGLEFSIIVETDEEPKVSLYFFSSVTKKFEILNYNLVKSGIFYKAMSKSSYFDGYILGKINNKSIVVKKVGYPINCFLVGYKENYTIPYSFFSEDGNKLSDGNLINIVDGFYYCEINNDVTIVETLKKRFFVKTNNGKLNYDVTMGNAQIDDVTLPTYDLSTNLGVVTLPDITLDAISQNVTMPQVTIKEY